jgi:hypothetical protein
MIGPSDGAAVGGLVQLSAVVDDENPVTLVQFLVDGVPVGVTSHAPFSATWDSTAARRSAPHTVAARATDALGRSATSAAVSLTVDNGPTISQVVTTPGLTTSSVRVDWRTDVASDGQVEYGATAAYGLVTPLQTQLAVTHEHALTGLQPATTYHLRVHSRDANGVTATSPDVTFTTPPDSTDADGS